MEAWEGIRSLRLCCYGSRGGKEKIWTANKRPWGGWRGFDWSPTTYISLYSVMTETKYRALIEKM